MRGRPGAGGEERKARKLQENVRSDRGTETSSLRASCTGLGEGGARELGGESPSEIAEARWKGTSFSKGPVRCGPTEVGVGVPLGAGGWEPAVLFQAVDRGQRERASWGAASAHPLSLPDRPGGRPPSACLGAAWCSEEREGAARIHATPGASLRPQSKGPGLRDCMAREFLGWGYRMDVQGGVLGESRWGGRPPKFFAQSLSCPFPEYPHQITGVLLMGLWGPCSSSDVQSGWQQWTAPRREGGGWGI